MGINLYYSNFLSLYSILMQNFLRFNFFNIIIDKIEEGWWEKRYRVEIEQNGNKKFEKKIKRKNSIKINNIFNFII